MTATPPGDAPPVGDRRGSDLRALALTVARAGLAALDPVPAVSRTLSVDEERLRTPGRDYDLAVIARVVVLGAGKASRALAQAVVHLLGNRIDDGLVIVRDGAEGHVGSVQVRLADHPLPTARSLEAGREMLAIAEGLGPNDLLVACFTGGSSALVSVPPPGVSPDEKRLLHELLLASGASIGEINTVRKNVSAIKGGRLARAAAPATVLNVTVSDAPGDALDLISDPTVEDTSTVLGARQVMERYALMDLVPQSIHQHLDAPERGPATATFPDVHSCLVVTGDDACRAMAAEAGRHGLSSAVLSTSLEGEAAAVGEVLAGIAREVAVKGRPFDSPCAIVGCGGESRVTLGSGQFGFGGPNQELALSFAMRLADGVQAALVALDTDGCDGSTSFAGGVVDAGTRRLLADAGIDVTAAFRDHTVTPALAAVDGLVTTGPTGTNVNDLFVLLVARPD